MPTSAILDSDCVLQAGIAPHPDSFDSAHEFSLERFLAVSILVTSEDEDVDRYIFDDACLHVA